MRIIIIFETEHESSLDVRIYAVQKETCKTQY